jgi:hypothetical protein
MKAIRSKPVRNTALSKGAKRAHVKRKPKRDMRLEHLHTLAKATFNCVSAIYTRLDLVDENASLQNRLTVMRFVLDQRAKAIEEQAARISELQSSQGTIPRTAWNTLHQTWEIVG